MKTITKEKIRSNAIALGGCFLTLLLTAHEPAEAAMRKGSTPSFQSGGTRMMADRQAQHFDRSPYQRHPTMQLGRDFDRNPPGKAGGRDPLISARSREPEVPVFAGPQGGPGAGPNQQ